MWPESGPERTLMINRISDELLIAASRRPASSMPTPETPEEQGVATQVKQWATELEKTIAAHPGASLMAALGAGILLGWWVKRT
jgi:hypothetical protein